jgi:hypothetical protein
MAKKDTALPGVAARRYWREPEARLAVDAWRGRRMILVTVRRLRRTKRLTNPASTCNQTSTRASS